jgi:hypothetical protein
MSFLPARSNHRFWHRRQSGRQIGRVGIWEVYATAIADLGSLIATRKQHATEDEAECRRPLAADSQVGTQQVRSSFVS